MTVRPAAAQAGCHRRGPVLLLTPSRQTIDKEALMRKLLGGILQNTVIHTFPYVSQFWTFKAEDFPKNSDYSHDYPPCAKC